MLHSQDERPFDVPIGNIGFDKTKHLLRSFRYAHEHTTIDLDKAE
jgi:hypothetical protein